MRENILLVLKGFVIGIGKIIPGVSGAMLAISLGIYEKGLDVISNIFKNFKENMKFLISLGIGLVIAILLFSKIIDFALINYYLPTMLLFIGLIAGGIPSIFKDVKDKVSYKTVLISVLTFAIVIGMSTIFEMFKTGDATVNSGFIYFFIMGIVDALTIVIPGISGTAVLISLGSYDIIIHALGTITDFSLLMQNLTILIPFGLGTVFGILGLAKIMSYFFKHHKTGSYFAIMGFAVSSLLMMIFETFKSNYSIGTILIGLVLMVIGYFIGRKFEG